MDVRLAEELGSLLIILIFMVTREKADYFSCSAEPACAILVRRVTAAIKTTIVTAEIMSAVMAGIITASIK